MTSPVAVGDVLEGKYRVERVIGTGGMGMVVAATHLELGQLVAMKFLLAEGLGTPEVAVRFVREARAVARIRSEHVARVLDVGRLASGSPYIVMEYLDGTDLEGLLRNGPLAIEEATDFVIQACDAMAAAHRLGIVHRDLKPANLFLTRQLDGSPIVKVLDFGISKSVFDSGAGALTNAGALVGSPLYMSPEQMRSAKDVDARTDIWSLGAVLFELLAGRPPFLGDSITALIAAISLDQPGSLREFRADLPPPLVDAIMRCLEKDPARRFADVAELARALGPFAPQRAQVSIDRAIRIVGSVPPPPTTTPPPPRPSSTPPSQTPQSLRAPPSFTPPVLDNLSVATTAAAAKGTATDWTNGDPSPQPKRRGTLVIAGLALFVVGGVALALTRAKAPPQLDSEPPTSSRPATAAAPAREKEPAPGPASSTLTPPSAAAPLASAPAASASASAPAPAPAPSPKLRQKAIASATASPATPTTTTEGKKSGLSMKIK